MQLAMVNPTRDGKLRDQDLDRNEVANLGGLCVLQHAD